MDKKRFWEKLPDRPGVYFFKDIDGKIIYVGKAINLKKRVGSYFLKSLKFGNKTKALIDQIKSVEFIIVENELEALLLEANLIKGNQPKYNVRFTDGKAYPFICITASDTYPKVLEARKISNDKSLYFGPYPSVGAMRMVLRTIRRIFPYQSVENHPQRPCLYYHIGLCPCPTVFDSKQIKSSYKKTIRYLIAFLRGEKKDLLALLIKHMKQLAKEERFEDAAFAKRQIEGIELVTSSFHNPIEYLKNPNLITDIRGEELGELKNVLEKEGISTAYLSRIECYDISNIQGRSATGSMVVFINGEKDTSSYRRFRIRVLDRPNDVLMMREVLQRRLVHKEWAYPDLIIVDGGKGQVGGVDKILKEKSLAIPLIGLAKRLEEIIIQKDKTFKLVRLPPSSPALHLLRRIRDEAHRFAIQYHKKLRSKSLFDRSDLH